MTIQPFIHRIVEHITQVVQAFKHNIIWALALIAFLIVIHLLNLLVGRRLCRLGIIPRRIIGLRGLLFAPFIHASWNHLFLNSVPLLILSSLLLIHGLTTFFIITGVIMLIGGGLTWFVAERGLHIGASGLIMGYWSFAMTQAIFDFNIVNLMIGLLCLLYLGYLIINILPTGNKNVSWEGHLFGALGGIAAIYSTPWLLQFI